MNRFRSLAWAVLLLGLIIGCAVQSCRLRHALQRAESAEAAEEMVSWALARELSKVQPTVPVPAGAKPVVAVRSRGTFGPRISQPGSGGTATPPPSTLIPGPGGETTITVLPPEPGGVAVADPSSPATAPAPWPTPADLACDCDLTIAEAADGSWWAKGTYTARLRLEDGAVLSRPDVPLEMAVEVAKSATAPKAKRLTFEVGIGATDGLHARGWGSVAWKRAGLWAALDSDGRRAGGVLWRF